MAAKVGELEKFTGGEDFELYEERLEQHFIANDLEELTLNADGSNREAVELRNKKRRAVFISQLDSGAYSTLRNLVAPEKPQDKTYDELLTVMRDHYCPKPSEALLRYKFYNRKQKPNESVSEFVSQLRKMAEPCNFGNQFNNMIKDRIMCGVKDVGAQRKIFAEKEMTYEKALSIAQGQEMAASNVATLQEKPSASVAAVSGPMNGARPKTRKFGNRNKSARQPERNVTTEKPKKVPCERCGYTNHTAEECRYKTIKCFGCGEIGHMRSQCKVSKSKKSHNKFKGKVRYVDESDDDDGVDDFTLFNVNDCNRPPIKIDVKLSGADVVMEVDTGAAASVMCKSDYDKYLKHVPLKTGNGHFRAYGGEILPLLGTAEVEVVYANQKKLLPLHVVNLEKNAPPLFGRGWLEHIVLDWPKLLGHSVNQVEPRNVPSLLEKYDGVFQPGLGKVTSTTATLHMKADANPVFVRHRPVPFAMKTAVEKELDRMQNEGIIYPVEYSDWATPIVCVPKADGSVRICGDYKVTVNRMLNIERFPIPTPDEVFSIIGTGEKFSKIDLKCAYQQLVLDDKSQELVTISTHKGLFRYTRLPYGISSSPAIWQRFVEKVLVGLPFTCVIMDDVIVSGANDEDHLLNLEAVLQRFEKYGLKVNSKKCSFLQDKVIYMGRQISAKGLQPTTEKVEAIRQAPIPTNVTELRSWLGMVNFQAKFIPHLAALAYPLNSLLGNKKWSWTSECTKSFDKIKEVISSETLLRHYDPKKEVTMATDASPYGLAAVIMQKDGTGKMKPVAYASRSLNVHEKGYAQLDKEGLAIMFGLQKFIMYLYGRHFTILTDNKPLERIFGPKTSIPTLAAQRLQRWAVILSAYDYELKHISSKENVLADALSRLPLPEKTGNEDKSDIESLYRVESARLEGLPVMSKDIERTTAHDVVLSQVLRMTRDGWPNHVDDLRLKPYFDRRCELTIEQNCLLWGLRVVIPEKYRKYILDELHVAHSGIVRMKEVARSFVWWPGIDQDIELIVRNCSECQEVRNLPPVAPLTPWMWPGSPWSRIHVDYAEYEKKDYLVITDAYSKWPEVIPMNSTTSLATIKELRSLFASYGLPRQVVSDNGPQFRSEEFAEFLRQNGVKHVRVAPYHAASNGAAERLVQSFKRSLKAGRNDNRSVDQRLSNFLLSYRSTKNTTTGRTPSELFLGRELRTRMTLIRPDVTGNVLNKQADQKSGHDVKCQDREYYVGDAVYARDIVKSKWWLGTVTQRTAPKSYVVSLQDGRLWKRHVEHLRPASQDKTLIVENYENNENQEIVSDSGISVPHESVPLVFPQGITSSVEEKQSDQIENYAETVQGGNVSSRPCVVSDSGVTPGRSVAKETSVRPVRQRNKPQRLIETI